MSTLIDFLESEIEYHNIAMNSIDPDGVHQEEWSEHNLRHMQFSRLRKIAELDFVGALKISQAVLDQYKIDQLKWWKRMDGTPILNDIAVRMAEAFIVRVP